MAELWEQSTNELSERWKAVDELGLRQLEALREIAEQLDKLNQSVEDISRKLGYG